MKSLLIKTYCNYVLFQLKVTDNNLYKELTYKAFKALYTKIGLVQMVDDGTLRSIIYNAPIEKQRAAVRSFKKHQDFSKFMIGIIDISIDHASNVYQKSAESTVYNKQKQTIKLHRVH